MDQSTEKSNHKQKLIAVATVAGFAILLYGGYFSYITYQDLQKTKEELDITVQTSSEAISLLTQEKEKLIEENANITSFLTAEQKRNIELERDQKRSERKIDELEKLTTLDPELLKKYSKVFFLSENYEPPKLREIDDEYKINPDKEIKVLREVEPYLTDLLQDAEDDGVNLRVISGYRSYETQQSLKNTYVTTYGSGANQFSADQGYSEHQLGTTVDFGTPEIQGPYLSFENSLAFDWLEKNAHKYGFILSYPSGNSYYQYEPWHWRFVGEDLADDLHRDNKSFYELDQREIDKYLLKIFD